MRRTPQTATPPPTALATWRRVPLWMFAGGLAAVSCQSGGGISRRRGHTWSGSRSGVAPSARPTLSAGRRVTGPQVGAAPVPSAAATAMNSAADPPPQPPQPSFESLPKPEHGRLIKWGDPVPAGHYICDTDDETSALACRLGAEICCDRTCFPAKTVAVSACPNQDTCNSRADCPFGQECCPDFYFVESMISQAKGGPLMPRFRCAPGPCRDQELCRPGTCRGNKACSGRDEGPYAIGQCTLASSKVHCGDKICEGDKPNCKWSGDSGECVARMANGTIVRCDDHSDCATGDVCWVHTEGRSYCCRVGACMDHSNWSAACDTARDCERTSGTNARFTCEPISGFPPNGIHGVCQRVRP